MITNSSLVLLFLSIVLSIKLNAQGPPITLTAPGTLGFQGSAIRTFGTFSNFDDKSVYTQVFAVPYNVSTNFQIGVIGRYSIMNPDGMSGINGFNNSTLFLKHQFYAKNDIGKTFRISGLVRQSFPTAKKGIGLEIYQTYVGLVAGDISTKRGFYTNLGYNITSHGSPDNFQYDFSAGIPLLPQVYPLKQLNSFIELNGNTALKGKNHVLFLSPGLQLIRGSFLIEGSFQIPIVQEVESNSDNKFKVLFGTRILI